MVDNIQQRKNNTKKHLRKTDDKNNIFIRNLLRKYAKKRRAHLHKQ